MKRQTTQFIILVLLGASLAGCAFGERQADLQYPPPADEGYVIASAQAAPAPSSKNARTVVIVKFRDLRPEKKVVGHVLNGFGMKTAEVVSQSDVGAWVSKGLQWELEKKGYRVRQIDSGSLADSGTADTVISGEVVRVYCSAYFEYDGEVTLRAKLTKDGRTAFERTYTGKATGGLNLAATGASYARTLSLALQDGLRQLVADITREG